MLVATGAAAMSGLLVFSTRAVAPPRRTFAAPSMHMPASGDSASSGSCTTRASLEVLAAVPHDRSAQSEEHIREMDAAEALWCRLKQERRIRMQHEGEPQANKEAFERIARAQMAYSCCLEACMEDDLDLLCRAGKTEEADALRRLMSACEQLVDDYDQLWKQGAHEGPGAAEAIVARIEALFEPAEEGRGCLSEEAERRRRMKEVDMEIDAGLPRGTLARLERAFRSCS